MEGVCIGQCVDCKLTSYIIARILLTDPSSVPLKFGLDI